MIDKLIEEINKALENELYFSALSLALTLPDWTYVNKVDTKSATLRRTSRMNCVRCSIV